MDTILIDVVIDTPLFLERWVPRRLPLHWAGRCRPSSLSLYGGSSQHMARLVTTRDISAALVMFSELLHGGCWSVMSLQTILSSSTLYSQTRSASSHLSSLHSEAHNDC
ncbi:hypothetical protein PoB_000300400 [Plakobranchus ocellatus]|uniref:Uncharacterized protein n=1 Tax=Plakobranchus ocellatus TaxID=259542 RepID=A0AAV3Y0M4_9GAST|nr:hypothetical protein PoB_000300400 [Plakobranchus ocellatus]